MKTWKNLNNPPVIVALLQIKYNSSDIKLSDFLTYDALLREKFPVRSDNINVGLDLGNSTINLGVSKISATSDAKIDGHVYITSDRKERLEFQDGTITYIDERPYEGWTNFKESTLCSLRIIFNVLNTIEILRTSIRFINRFTFDNFDNPQEYFKTLISSSADNQQPFPLRQYGFRLIMDVPNTHIHTVVNQNVENIRNDSFIYMFDIDVLDKKPFKFELETISENMELLRNIKNQIFFNNLTQKTIDLCN